MRTTPSTAPETRACVTLAPAPAGHDTDIFDGLADHLIVTETVIGEVVGTYRLLPPGRTERSYSDGEFDLSALAAQ
ncbi:GNAT family N-acetyltransferase [Streptomyces ochraceiscleroticus]|uniref:GNAT family N-acetyltransferase n=1 Tax=Streptomyces ochraceiscleroticus TaxID=47761 RepID=A0ABW1MRF1_9ACTN